jgi:hypothetical protein
LIARALFLEVVRSRLARGKHFKELHLADVSDTARVRVLDLFVQLEWCSGAMTQMNWPANGLNHWFKSAVAACYSSASSNSRVSRATSFLAGGRRTVSNYGFQGKRAPVLKDLRDRALAGLPPFHPSVR